MTKTQLELTEQTILTLFTKILLLAKMTKTKLEPTERTTYSDTLHKDIAFAKMTNTKLEPTERTILTLFTMIFRLKTSPCTPGRLKGLHNCLNNCLQRPVAIK